jgi:hypothetical protein
VKTPNLTYKNPVRTSLETHYVSATDISRLMLCGDYEEYRPVGYKKPIRTSQETHYVSATNLSRLMLCGDYEEYSLPGYKYPVNAI